MNKAVLTFFCGKMASGKSTHSIDIARERNAVLLSEDEWLESMYPNKVKSLDSYIEYSNRLKPQIKKLAQSILSAGTDVVMDFPGNTIKQRNWFREIFSEIDASHNLVYIELEDEDCIAQMMKRRVQQPERAATDTEEIFIQVTKYFQEPESAEGFNITVLSKND
jgi:predicted kinase